MGLISFKDWLLQQESSAFTRMRDNPFYRKLISPAAMHSRSTWPGGIEVVPKKKKKSKKKKSKKKHMSETWQSVLEGKAKQPDYSFDQWLLKALSKKIEIEDLLDQYIKPAVESDGGSITLDSFENGIVTVNLSGACSGCPSSTITLKQGIESLLKQKLGDKVQEVIAKQS